MRARISAELRDDPTWKAFLAHPTEPPHGIESLAVVQARAMSVVREVLADPDLGNLRRPGDTRRPGQADPRSLSGDSIECATAIAVANASLTALAFSGEGRPEVLAVNWLPAPRWLGGPPPAAASSGGAPGAEAALSAMPAEGVETSAHTSTESSTHGVCSTEENHRHRVAETRQPMFDFDAHSIYHRRMWHYESDRQLSVAQLIALGSLDARTAALLWLLVERHQSLIVSGPTDPTAGAGKTTTLNALLGFLPAGSTLVYTQGMFEDFAFQSEVDPPTTCVLANEVSNHLRIYMWGQVARKLLRLPQQNYAIATSCHADTVEDVLAMLCDDLRLASPGCASPGDHRQHRLRPARSGRRADASSP